MKQSFTSVLFVPVMLVSIILGGCATPEPAKVEPKKPAPAAKAPAAVKPVTSAKPIEAPKPAAPAPVAVNKPEAAPAPAPVLPPAVIPNPAKKAEVLATVEHLTQDGQANTLAHEIVDTTGFPAALDSLAPGAQAPKQEAIYIGIQPPIKGLTADGNSTALVEKDWTGLVLVPLNTSLSKAHTSAVRLMKIEAHPLSDGRVRIWIRVKNIDDKALPTEIACVFRMSGEETPESPYFYELDVPGQAYRDVFFVSPSGQLNTYTVLVRPKFNY
jgi:hypothetical protein